MNVGSLLGLLFFVLPQVGAILHAQAVNRDSLQAIVENPPNDTADLVALRELAISYVSDKDSLTYYYRTLLNLAKERGDSLWMARSRNSLAGNGVFGANPTDSALLYNQLAIDFYERHPGQYLEDAIGAWLNRGVIHQMATNYGPAVEHYNRAYELMESTGKKKYLKLLLNNLGIIHRTQGDFQAAEEVYRRSLAIKEEEGDIIGMAITNTNLGVALLSMDSISAAAETFQYARQLYIESGDIGGAIGVDMLLGQALYNEDRFMEALEIWENALSDDRLNTDATTYVSTTAAMAELYIDSLQQTERAKQYLDEAITYAPYIRDERTLISLDLVRGKYWQSISRFDSAAFYLARHAERRRVFYEEEKLRNEQMMSERFQSALRKSQLDQQAAELAQQEADLAAGKARQRFWTVLAISLAGLAIGVWLLARYRANLRRVQSQQRELEQNREIERVQREATESNLRSLVEGQEAERQRIAKELHDGLGGLLATVSRGVGDMVEQLQTAGTAKDADLSTSQNQVTVQPSTAGPAEVQNQKTASQKEHPTQSLIDQACADLRQIAHDLAPQALTVSGLAGAMEDIRDQLQMKGLACELDVHPDLDQALNTKQQSMLLRLVQELTHNVVKHAGAQSVFLQLIRAQDRILLIVEDDGQGFDLAAVEGRQSGLGINSIRQRVTFLHGELEIDTAPGRGTTVVVSMPVGS
ncbi:MAG: sensor histidine kinase [Bacteroidota bacterium]